MASTDEATLAQPAHGSLPEPIAGRLCLDFANTVEPRVAAGKRQPHEYLRTYAGLVSFSVQAGSVPAQAGKRLMARAQRRPAAAAAALDQAVELREAIYRVFSAVAAQSPPNPDDLALLSSAYAAAIEHARLDVQGGRTTLAWAGDADDLAQPLWQPARSAVELLLEAEPERIKVCPAGSGGCGWLFYDTSKNNSRRWCRMRTCGGREKERRRSKVEGRRSKVAAGDVEGGG